MNNDAEAFLHKMAAGLTADERIILSKFAGDPNKMDKSAWRPISWYPGAKINMAQELNVYCTVSAFTLSEDGTFRRRISNFSAGVAFMVDDIGTKVDAEAVDGLLPSAVIETSPGNFQYWYFFNEPCREMSRFDALIRAFITKIGEDPGMAGVNRVGRLPGYTNGKEKYAGFITQMHSLTDARYSIEQLVAGLGLELIGRVATRNRLMPADARERNLGFMHAYKWLAGSGIMKARRPDKSGWFDISCPWVDGHTGAADNGAAIREPHEENGYYGGFRCHHGSCKDRGWADLTQWISEQAEDINNRTSITEYEKLLNEK